MKYVIGVDAGTTCFKASIYDENLNTIKIVSEEYPLTYKNGFVEIYPQEYWNIFCRLTRSLLATTKIAPQNVVGISICSQGETLILLDESGEPLRPAIVWTDARAGDQANRLKQIFSDKEVFRITGQREITATWPASKILWIKENEQEVFHKCSNFLLLEDYLIYRLTGHFVTDKSVSSSTAYLDIYRLSWWNDMLETIGISEEKLPTVLDSGDIIGNISIIASKETGLSTVTDVVAGALDQAAGMLGAGNIKKGIITETTGTCLAVCANIGNTEISFEKGLLPIHHGIAPNSYYAIYWSPAAGSIYNWITSTFYKNDTADNLFKMIDDEASLIPPGCDGLYVLPFFSGMNYPFACEKAKGIFGGLTLAHDRSHFTRATLESIAFLLRQSVDEISKYGIKVNDIYSLGGGSNSTLWNQIKAHVTDHNIYTLEEKEVTCKGVAILAAVSCGFFNNLEEAVRKTVVVRDRYQPNHLHAYDEIYEHFLNRLNTYIDTCKSTAL